MKNFTDEQLYMILSWAENAQEDGRWDDSEKGRTLQKLENDIFDQIHIEIKQRGYTLEDFNSKFYYIYMEYPQGTYWAH